MRIPPFIVFFVLLTIVFVGAAQMDKMEQDSRDFDSYRVIGRDTAKNEAELEKLKQENQKFEKEVRQKLKELRGTGASKKNP